MDSRQRIKTSIEHNQPDKLPVDFGGMSSTGMHVSIIYKLRQRLGLDEPLTPVKVIEPYQMLGEIKEDLRKVMGSDCVPIWGRTNIFGFNNNNWKEWQLWDGTTVLIPGNFNTIPEDDGSILMYSQGDRSTIPSAKMPYKGYYFDTLARQANLDDEKLKVEDNCEEFKVVNEKEINYLKNEAEKYYDSTRYSLFGTFVNSGFGDIALIPGPGLKHPKGIRDITEWYISLISRKEHIRQIFNEQCEIALENYRKIFKAIGNKIDVVMTTGTDFAMQNGLLISKELFNDLFKPFHKKINKWIHENTDWKIFLHSCGAVEPLIEDFIDAGFDILNPIQISAKGMDLKTLKHKYGERIVFWGGGIDTQKTLPMGTPKQVKEEVKRNIEILFKDGGFIFSTVHNIQANVPVDNIMAMIDVIKEYRK